MKTLTELIATLVRCSTSEHVAPDAPRAFTGTSTPVAGYVAPNLTSFEMPEASRVLLIEAIGAVGKSAAARCISAELNWPLIDSSQAQVGEYSLTGILHDAIGVDSSFLQRLARGETGIVIDALDEAHLRVGTSNFVAFLDNIIQLTNPAAGSGVSVVLMSRPDTAEYVRLRFDERARALATARIDFFDLKKAETFAINYLEQVAGRRNTEIETAVAKYRDAFSRLCALRFQQIATALTGHEIDDLKDEWSTVRSFLGYAPVISVIAESIAVPNPHRELTSSSLFANSSSSILMTLVETILERESDKFRNQTVDYFLAHVPVESNWRPDNVYGAREQIDRLLKHIRMEETPVSEPADLPDVLRNEYEGRATQFILDHPFVTDGAAVNVVFSDYLEAHLAADPHWNLRISTLPSERAVGPFFFRFTHRLAAALQGVDGPTVPERLLGHLIHSHAQIVDSNDEFAWLLSQSADSAVLDLFDRLNAESLSFAISELSGVLEFREGIRYGLVVSDEAVSIGSREGTATVGPRALIVAQEVLVEAEVLSVESASGALPSVRLVAREIAAARLRKVTTYANGALQVVGASEHPVLRRYQSNVGVPDGLYVSYSSYVDLRSILRFFRKTVHNDNYVINSERLDHQIVGASESRQSLLDSILKDGIVYKEAGVYCLDSDRLGHHGVSFASVMSGTPDKSVLALLSYLRNEMQ
jgi:hypothetical protein